jgi:hypothetical protein
MNPGEDTSPATHERPGPDAAADEVPTGLPWLRTWPAVYWFVFGCFVVCVALLAVLTAIFS